MTAHHLPHAGRHAIRRLGSWRPWIVLTAAWLVAGSLASGHPTPDVRIDWTPPTVDPAAFFFMTLSITVSHSNIIVEPLDINRTHVDGFDLAGMYDERMTLTNGIDRIAYHIRLRPQAGTPRFRLAPLALTWRDTGNQTNPGPRYHRIPGVTVPRQSPATPHPPDLIAPPAPRAPPAWLILLGLAAGLTAAGLWLRRRMTGHPRTPLPDPAREAVNALRNLMRRPPSDYPDDRETIARLRSIVRRFIQRLDPSRPPTETSAELLAALRQRSTQPKMWIDLLQIFFNRSESILFSDHPPDPIDASTLAGMVETLVTTAVDRNPDTPPTPETIKPCGH